MMEKNNMFIHIKMQPSHAHLPIAYIVCNDADKKRRADRRNVHSVVFFGFYFAGQTICAARQGAICVPYSAHHYEMQDE